MFRSLQKLIIVVLMSALVVTPSQAMFVQPDWLDPTHPGVGTNRYAYSFNDPINKSDPGGNCVAGCAGDAALAGSGPPGWAVLGVLGAIVVGKLAYDYLTQPTETGVSIGDGTISGSVPGLGEILGPGDDISNPGAAEPNIERGKPYGGVVEGIQGLPGATVTGEFDTPWGKGKVIELPDGTKISARPGSKSGGPTIEVTDPDGNTEKNRFPEQEAEEEGEQEGTKDDE